MLELCNIFLTFFLIFGILLVTMEERRYIRQVLKFLIDIIIQQPSFKTTSCEQDVFASDMLC